MVPPDALFALLGDVRLSSRALRQLRALRDDGLSVEVLTLGPPAEGALAARLPLGDGLRVRALPRPEGRGPGFFWRAHRLFERAARDAAAGVYLASDLYVLPALAAAAGRHGGRLAYDARELYGALDDAARRPWVGWAWGEVERRFIRRADVVFTVGDGIADRLERRYGIARPVLVRNLSEFEAAAPSDRLRRELAIPDGTPIALYQGLLRHGRGLPALVAAFAEVEQCVLVVIGHGPLEGELRRRAGGLDARVRFIGFVPPDDLPAYTASADLGVLPTEPLTESLRLSLPNKLFEYLSAGLPVLASPIPEVRRVVEGFDVGLVADPADPPALAAALHRALTDADARARWRSNIPRALAAHRWADDAARFTRAICALLR